MQAKLQSPFSLNVISLESRVNGETEFTPHLVKMGQGIADEKSKINRKSKKKTET